MSKKLRIWWSQEQEYEIIAIFWIVDIGVSIAQINSGYSCDYGKRY